MTALFPSLLRASAVDRLRPTRTVGEGVAAPAGATGVQVGARGPGTSAGAIIREADWPRGHTRIDRMRWSGTSTLAGNAAGNRVKPQRRARGGGPPDVNSRLELSGTPKLLIKLPPRKPKPRSVEGADLLHVAYDAH